MKIKRDRPFKKRGNVKKGRRDAKKKLKYKEHERQKRED